MPNLAFDFTPPLAPIAGEDQMFPVRRIYCVGRNYADHVREMGGDPQAQAPIFFMKPPDAVVTAVGALPFPGDTEALHHEVELVVAIGRGGRDIPASQADSHVFGYAVGIDLTKRDRQAEAKQAGQPWERAKAFDRSAPISPIRPRRRVETVERGRIWLAVNGEMRQAADLSNLIWPVPEIIAQLSTLWTLAPGDLIFTGTPEGVGPLLAGDMVTAAIEDIGRIEFRIG